MIPDETFRKKEHILKSKDFRVIYKRGRSFRKSGFVLAVMPNDLPNSRLGFSISSANIKRACIRNRIRRLFREFYRKNKPRFKPAFDMVVIVRKNPGKKFLCEEANSLFAALAKEAGILL
ncbi:MAG: ribonuclease P protein component [Candidatus Omnitrophica bacterium]|nr:ribonuclease P protein component [Candidatus Omnitrophota bacterium]MBU1038570.1 ribonuclease P protein component [Candidatus Omnitrophota bacterium]MBU1808358.1 ribonuclease P protein component [Candidatus Omnitrophota bacterium]